MILVRSRAYDHLGRKCGHLSTVRNEEEDCWITTVLLTEDFPDGPDIVELKSWTADAARTMHLGTARAIAGRDGRVVTEVPGLMAEGGDHDA